MSDPGIPIKALQFTEAGMDFVREQDTLRDAVLSSCGIPRHLTGAPPMLPPDLEKLLTLTASDTVPWEEWDGEIRLALADCCEEHGLAEVAVKGRTGQPDYCYEVDWANAMSIHCVILTSNITNKGCTPISISVSGAPLHKIVLKPGGSLTTHLPDGNSLHNLRIATTEPHTLEITVILSDFAERGIGARHFIRPEWCRIKLRQILVEQVRSAACRHFVIAEARYVRK